MEVSDAPTLEVGFAIETTGSFTELQRLQAMLNSTENTAIKAAVETERKFNNLKLGGAAAQVALFGNAATKEMLNVARETERVEKASDRLTRQIMRQTEEFGKTAAQIRTMRVDKVAAEFERLGNAADAAALRGVNAELQRLEQGAGRAGTSVGATRSAMQGLSFQAQDAFTQISMGTNAFSVLAIQGGQAAGQMSALEGKLGSFARFMIGPWGLAITAGLLVLGALTKGMFDNEDASKAAADGMKKFQDRQSDIGNFIDETTGKLVEQNRVLVLNAVLTRQKQIADNAAAITKGRNAAFELAGEARSGPAVQSSFAREGVTRQQLDPDVQRAIRAANGDVETLAKSIGVLAMTKRPDLKGLALDISTQAGSAILATRETKKLSEELRALTGNATIATKGTASLVEKQVALATATTPLARAQAQLDLVKQQGAAAEKAGGAALEKYRSDLTAATVAVNGARAAERDAAGARRDSARETRLAATEAKEAQRKYEALVKSAQDYAIAQEQTASRLGLSAKAIRALEDAAARAKAPTEELRLAIDRAAASREAAYGRQSARDFETGILQPLRDELALYGLVGPARAQAVLEMEMEAFVAKNLGDGITVALQRWREYYDTKSALIAKDAAAEREVERVKRLQEQLDALVGRANDAADAMARAFGRVGGAIGDAVVLLTEYGKRQKEIQDAKGMAPDKKAAEIARLQLTTTTSLIGATKSLFSERSKGYAAMAAAEKALAAIQLAISIKNMAQDALATASAIAKSGARAAANAVEAVAKAIASLPFPLNLAAGAATAAALASIGIAIGGAFGGGGKNNLEKANDGKGTVLGDKDAQSESLKRSLDLLREVDTLMLTESRRMAASLRSIDSQIGGLATLLVRSGNLSADAQVAQGFAPNAIGSVLGSIPLIGGILGGLFGTKTKVIGSGIYGGAMSLDAILAGAGYDAQTYSDVERKKKFFGLTTSKKFSTVYGGQVDGTVSDQFGLILRSFNDAILAAAGPLGTATDEIKSRLSGFVFSLGKLDLTGLSGTEIQEKLAAVFGAAADRMAETAFPGISRFQKVGEGALETLIRVSSTVEAVTATLDSLGKATIGLSMDAKVALAAQFDTIGDFTSAAQSYFDSFYTSEEQASARAAQLTRVFGSMNMVMPRTLTGFRQLVGAQDLTTDAGRAAYATLLQLAPAFSDLMGSLGGAKTAADAANDLREAWTSIGDSIADEVKRIRGLANGGNNASFATLQGQFNAATIGARGGDQAMAKMLPELSQNLLAAAERQATSRQELDRIRALTASSLEQTNASIISRTNALTLDELLDRTATAQAASTRQAANDVVDATDAQTAALRQEIVDLKDDLKSVLASIAGSSGKTADILRDVSDAGGGNSLQMNVAAV